MPSGPHVAVITHTGELSGAEIALADLTRNLRRSTITAYLGQAGPLADALSDAGAAVVVRPLPGASGAVGREEALRAAPRQLRAVTRYARWLARDLRGRDVDVVQLHSMKALFYGGLAGRIARIPTLWHLHDRLAPDYMPAAVAALSRAAGVILADKVVANSFATQATLNRILSSRAEVIYPAVRQLDPSAVTRHRGGGDLRFAIIGRLAPWKGQDVVLRAFADAFPEGGEQLVVVGSAMFSDEEYAASLRALTRRLGLEERVEFTGFRSDVEDVLAEIDVLVHASTVPEPFGKVIIEGMAMGLPVVAADAGGPREIIRARRDGLLTPPGDVEALAAALKGLAHDLGLRRELGNAAKERVSLFDAATVAAETERIYDDLAATRRRKPGRP